MTLANSAGLQACVPFFNPPAAYAVIGLLAVFIVQLAFAGKRRAKAGELAKARLESEIEAHQLAEQALHTTYSELAAIYANAPVALLVVDEYLRVEKANRRAAAFAEPESPHMVGLRAGPVIGCLDALDHPEGCGYGPACDRCEIRRAALDSLRHGVKHDGVEAWVPVSIHNRRERRCLLISSSFMEFGGRKALICVQDITSGKRAEQELLESRAKLTTALAEAEASHSLLAAAFTAQYDAVFVYDAEGTLLLTNPAAARYLGTRATGAVLPDVIARLHIEGGLGRSATVRALCGENVVNAERSAGDRMLEISSAPMLNAGGQITGAVTVMHDITQRRRIEDALQATLRELEAALTEKTVLLKEVHHRVKNNLAVVSSLLSMKADATELSDARMALEDSQQRVRSIALIHEQLYGTDHLDRIDFAHYAQELVTELNVACGAAQRGILVRVDSEPIQLEVNRAVPCALIMNELVTNALKHAFPSDRRGEVGIAFRKSAPGWLELEIADTGVGCPEVASGAPSKSLGLRIVQILTTQLDGSIRQERGNGTRFVLRFPAESAAPGPRSPAPAAPTCETSPSSVDCKPSETPAHTPSTSPAHPNPETTSHR
jgi:PAS domain S-box-containing protein